MRPFWNCDNCNRASLQYSVTLCTFCIYCGSLSDHVRIFFIPLFCTILEWWFAIIRNHAHLLVIICIHKKLVSKHQGEKIWFISFIQTCSPSSQVTVFHFHDHSLQNGKWNCFVQLYQLKTQKMISNLIEMINKLLSNWEFSEKGKMTFKRAL